MARIEMTDELAEQLKGILPISIEARTKLVPSIFLKDGFPEEFRPVFTLRPMTRIEKTSFFSGDDDKKAEVLFSCIDKCENLWSPETKSVVELSDDIFEGLHYSVRSEIRESIFKMSGLLDAEALGLK